MTTATKNKPAPASHGHAFLYFAAVASLSILLFGYDTGVVSGALLFLKTQYHLSPAMQEVVTGVVLVGAVLGAAGSGCLANRLGRRVLMIGTAAVFLIGVLVTALAPGVAVLIAGRIIVGVGIGVASYLGPLYISEISSADRRGSLVALNQLLLTLASCSPTSWTTACPRPARGAGCSASPSSRPWRWAPACCCSPKARAGCSSRGARTTQRGR